MLKNTNVKITADHGDMLASHGLREKGFPFNSNLNIPFMLYSPLIDHSQYNTTSEYIGTCVDLIPTIMMLNNFNTTSHQFTGESLIKPTYNGKFVSKNTTDNMTKGALHLENATEGLLTWFSYINWYYNIATNEQKNKINDMIIFIEIILI